MYDMLGHLLIQLGCNTALGIGVGRGHYAGLIPDEEWRSGSKLTTEVRVRHATSGVTILTPAGTQVLRSHVRELELQCNFLSLEVVRSLLGGIQPQGVFGEEVDQVLELLNRLGVLIWLNEPKLRDLVMLNPSVVATAFADLMTLCHGAENFAHGKEYKASMKERTKDIAPKDLRRYQTTGVVSTDVMAKLWSDFDPHEQELLREVLVRKKLLVRRAMKDEFLVPCCLPLNHVPDGAGRLGDEVMYLDLFGVVSPNLFPTLAESLMAKRFSKSRVLRSGPPQIFRNRLEISAGGRRVCLSVCPEQGERGRWFVKIEVQGQRAEPAGAAGRIAKDIRKRLWQAKSFESLAPSVAPTCRFLPAP